MKVLRDAVDQANSHTVVVVSTCVGVDDEHLMSASLRVVEHVGCEANDISGFHDDSPFYDSLYPIFYCPCTPQRIYERTILGINGTSGRSSAAVPGFMKAK
jgi:hypothetical protein